MRDHDLIRRGDALYAIAGWEIPSTAIAALPAVTQPAPDAAAMTPEVKALVEAARKARDGLQWAQFHLNEAGMKSLSVDVGLMEIDAALAALRAGGGE